MIEDAYFVFVEVKEMELFGSVKVNEFLIDCAGVIEEEAMRHFFADKPLSSAVHDNSFKALSIEIDYLITLLHILLFFSLQGSMRTHLHLLRVVLLLHLLALHPTIERKIFILDRLILDLHMP